MEQTSERMVVTPDAYTVILKQCDAYQRWVSIAYADSEGQTAESRETQTPFVPIEPCESQESDPNTEQHQPGALVEPAPPPAAVAKQASTL